MNRLSTEWLRHVGQVVSKEDRDEMAIPSYLHKNPALRWMAWRRVEVVDAWMQDEAKRGGAVMVDYGCGTGVLFDDAVRSFRKVYAVDPVLRPAELLVAERGWTPDQITVLHPDQVESVIQAASVDLVVAAETLEHIEPLAPVIERIRRLLRPRGRLLASLPTEGALYRIGRALAGFSGHYHHQTADMIHAEICRSGFSLAKMTKIPAPGPLSIYWVGLYERR